MTLILFGFPFCGKSYYGKQLAEALCLPFLDTDTLIEERAGEEVRPLHRRLGETAFRALEKEVILSLSGEQPAVIALGGGAVFDPTNRAHLQTIGRLVYLRTDKTLLKQRLFSSAELPSYIDPKDPHGSYERIYTERFPLYEQIPAIAANATGKSVRALLEEIDDLLRPTPSPS